MNDKEMVQITLERYVRLNEKIEIQTELNEKACDVIESLLNEVLIKHFKKQTKIKHIISLPNSLKIRFEPIDEYSNSELEYLTYDELFNIIDVRLKSDTDKK